MNSIGFIGVGDLADYTITGLRLGGFTGDIYLSPRNAAMSNRLAQAHRCQVLKSNQAVVNKSECLIISTRPAHCLEALADLTFEPNQLLVSVVAGMPIADIQGAVPAGIEIVRAMPINAAQVGVSPTLIYPNHAGVSDLFNYCGDSVAVNSEAAFDQGSVLACVYTWYFSLFEQLIQSTTSKALSQEKAKALVLGMAKGAASLALQKSETSGDIAESIATPGTFSKLGLDVLKDNNAFAPWDEACTLLTERFTTTKH